MSSRVELDYYVHTKFMCDFLAIHFLLAMPQTLLDVIRNDFSPTLDNLVPGKEEKKDTPIKNCPCESCDNDQAEITGQIHDPSIVKAKYLIPYAESTSDTNNEESPAAQDEGNSPSSDGLIIVLSQIELCLARCDAAF